MLWCTHDNGQLLANDNGQLLANDVLLFHASYAFNGNIQSRLLSVHNELCKRGLISYPCNWWDFRFLAILSVYVDFTFSLIYFVYFSCTAEGRILAV